MDDSDLPVTAAATFAATLVDEWVHTGVTDAVVAPGSRSTPLALALAGDDRLRVHVHPDERSAAFTALGLATATGRPCVVLTTSGTAAAELHPAAVEADLGRVPLLLCTADRPAELQDVGAPQTIKQAHLFGSAVRWFSDVAAPDESSLTAARSLASRSVCEALGPPAGPVHLNIAFRDPLVGRAGPQPAGRSGGEPWHQRVVAPRRIAHEDALTLAAVCRGRPGVIVAGTGIRHPEHVLLLAHTLGWPVLADPRSGCRVPDRAVVAHFDAVVRSGVVEPPEVVIRLGLPPASKELAAWVARGHGVEAPGTCEIVIDEDGWWLDPGRAASYVVEADPSIAALELAPLLDDHPHPKAWIDQWAAADEAARGAMARVLQGSASATEPAIARATVASLPEDGALVVASSMPIRDVEWFAEPREGGRILANRGANGIDGVVSTAVGVALSGPPTRALVGDVAFLHDTNGLLGAAARDLDLTVVVVDNDGGGIFSFLPQASALPAAQFEQLFGTPHGLDVVAVAEGHGAVGHRVDDVDGLDALLEKCTGRRGVDVIAIATDRDANVAVHEAVHDATAAAVAEAWG